jgi:peptide/nickel transport system permease protein
MRASPSNAAAARAGAGLLAAARSLAGLLLTLLVLLVVSFGLSHLSPVDPVLARLGDHASHSAYLEMRHTLGLDAPWPLQLVRYLARLLRGDLGVSLSTGQPVLEDLARVFPATVELATLGMLAGTVLGVGLGVLAALRPGGAQDTLIRVVSLGGNSIPTFWLGLLLLATFYARLQWVGGPGRLDDAYEYTIDMPTGIALVDAWWSGVPGAFGSACAHLVLPVLVLAAYALGHIARITRTALLEETHKDYVTLARAKGAGQTYVLLRHVLPNAAGVLLTTLGLTYASLLEGAVLVETVFARPGLGRYLTTALFASDVPAILGATLAIGASFVVVNGLTDVLVRLADARTA